MNHRHICRAATVLASVAWLAFARVLPSFASDQLDASSLLDGVLAAREAIDSGMFEAAETRLIELGEGLDPRIGGRRIFCAFKDGWTRFDSEGHTLVISAENMKQLSNTKEIRRQDLIHANAKIVEEVRRIIRTPEWSAHFHVAHSRSDVLIQFPNHRPKDTFGFRTLGLVTRFEMNDEVSIQTIRERWRSRKSTLVGKEDLDGRPCHRVEMVSRNNVQGFVARTSLWIDADHDFAVPKYVIECISDGNQMPFARFLNTCEYAQIDAGWVPTRLVLQWIRPQKNDVYDQSLYEFKSVRINVEIPQNLFSLETMKLPDHVQVFDVRHSVVVGFWPSQDLHDLNGAIVRAYVRKHELDKTEPPGAPKH